MPTTLLRAPHGYYGCTHPYYRHVRAIRNEVLVNELGIPAEQEADGDHATTHWVLQSGKHGQPGTYCGTLRTYISSSLQLVQIQRLAVLLQYREGRYATRLLDRVLEFAAQQTPWYRVEVTARESDVGFYERFDFAPSQDPIDHYDTKYVTMELIKAPTTPPTKARAE